MICSVCRFVDDETFGVLVVQFSETLRVLGASLSLLKVLLEKESTSSMRFWPELRSLQIETRTGSST